MPKLYYVRQVMEEIVAEDLGGRRCSDLINWIILFDYSICIYVFSWFCVCHL